jgi:DNA-binding NtrC family response regulator
LYGLFLEAGLPVSHVTPELPMQTKVLIVEDDNAMAQMCAKLIRRRGHTVVIAGTGQDALAMIRQAADIDVVISDVQMPQMSGMQLLVRLRALDANLPIILMTGHANLLSPSEALALGAADYIMKPFEPETLICSLERVRHSRQKLTHHSAHT